MSDLQIERALILQTNDSGLITLLVNFGSLGVAWVAYKLFVLLQLFRYQIATVSSPIQFNVACLAFIFSIWATCVTTYGFTYPNGIVALALALFLFGENVSDTNNMKN